MRQACTLAELPPADTALARAAQRAARRAYAPYSQYHVGAALRSRSGRVFRGCNVENAAYGVVLCAEVGALAAAELAGAGDALEVIAVTGRPALGAAPAAVVTPCGRCRQLLLEAAQRAGGDIRVLCCNHDLSRIEVLSVTRLLPRGFGPRQLGR